MWQKLPQLKLRWETTTAVFIATKHTQSVTYISIWAMSSLFFFIFGQIMFAICSLKNYDETNTKSIFSQRTKRNILFTKKNPVQPNDSKKIFLHLRFLNSFRFLLGSLDKSSQVLTSDEWKAIKKYFSDRK